MEGTFLDMLAPFAWLNLVEKYCLDWIIVREKYGSGWKKKPNKSDYKISRARPLGDKQKELSNLLLILVQLYKCTTNYQRASHYEGSKERQFFKCSVVIINQLK